MARRVDVRYTESHEGAEVTLAIWLKQRGDTVCAHAPLLEISTNKATVEVAAPESGVLVEVLKESGERVLPGEVLGRIEVAAEVPLGANEPAQLGGCAAPPASSPEAALACGAAATEPEVLSPAVRRLLREHAIDAAQLPRTGHGGRITARDVERWLEQRAAVAKAPAPSRMLPHTPVRRAVAAHMVQSMLHTAPHVTAVFEADLTAARDHLQRESGDFAKKGARLTLTSYFIHAAARALEKVPEVNSRWHKDALELFDEICIGIAVALEGGGIVVPVISGVQRLDLLDIALHVHDLTERARSRSLRPQDSQGGTFTISNHGMTGSLLATPIIHQPQSAILGVGKIQKRAVVIAEGSRDTVQIRPMAYVTLTIDHRALDGATANAFLGHFVKQLEDGWAPKAAECRCDPFELAPSGESSTL